MVPDPLRRQVVELAHQSILGVTWDRGRLLTRSLAISTGPNFQER